MSNIIDIRSRIKSAQSGETSQSNASSEIVDISEKRAQIIQSDRRQVRRTILTEFISVHAIVPNRGLLKVQLYDINDKGLSFDLEFERGKFNIGEEVEFRIYLNHQTYFKIDAKIAHVTNMDDEGFVRHGCLFLYDSVNNEALDHFVKFIETVTASLKRDGGDILVSKINS